MGGTAKMIAAIDKYPSHKSIQELSISSRGNKANPFRAILMLNHGSVKTDNTNKH